MRRSVSGSRASATLLARAVGGDGAAGRAQGVRDGGSEVSGTGVFRSLATVVVRVADVEAAAAWYREKLGLEASSEHGDAHRCVFDVGGTTSLTLRQLERADVPMVPGAATSYPVFAVDDVDEVWRTLRERDVLVEPIVERATERCFQFLDLDGNRLEARQAASGG